MKRCVKPKVTILILLAAFCADMALWGCAAEEKKTDEPINAQTTSTLYEQFLNGEIPATVSSDYFVDGYAEDILEKNSALTLKELEDCVSNYYFDPEDTDKSFGGHIQYAYMTCPDSPEKREKSLLVKFMGLDIYSENDDSYAVFILSENNGQLSIIGLYECWDRSITTAYANGILSGGGSGGADYHTADLSAILSDGQRIPIYDAAFYSGRSSGEIDWPLYNEIFDDQPEPALTVSIYTIGNEKYYQYDMTYCGEAEIPLCEDYINRCREESAVYWSSDKEIETAVQKQCTAVGVDYALISQREEVVWNDL